MQIYWLALLITGWKVEEVSEFTEISRSQLYNIKKKVKKREFDPKICSIILAEYIQDAICFGQPEIHISKKNNVIGKVKRDRFGCKKSSQYIILEV